ncbi:hypothetical protein LJC71_01715 [Desulfosarcina sp. OttesenSCG-928-A07]|nr:hypothetical protein [Desulfosarcina sp. OttesenSCG-928-G17]MDL2328454.1 hypothetical protein [Desulfosarcina sp. OttesenSCG-928-A07]
MTHSSSSDAAARVRKHVHRLFLADPEAARRFQPHLENLDPAVVADALPCAVDALISALSVETAYGHAFIDGMGWLLTHGAEKSTEKRLLAYIRRVTAAATEKGPTLARLFADHLAVILAADNSGLLDHAEAAIRVMLKKGTYTLKAPLETLSALIRAHDTDSAHAFLDLLMAAFGLDLSYNRTVYLTHTLPRAVDGFERSRRLWQINGLTRIISVDERLADAYLEGLARGLHLLSAPALNMFLDQATRLYGKKSDSGIRFLSLDARQARDLCRDLQVAVPLSALRADLVRYLSARTGRMIRVAPLSGFPGHAADKDARVRCDGRTLYLPDELDLLDTRAANGDLYKLLARLEAGALEFGSYDLDAQRAFSLAGIDLPPETDSGAPVSELELFIRQFERPDIALDLFTLFEHGRIAKNIRTHYPGLFSRLNAAQQDPVIAGSTGGTLFPLYAYLVMGQPLPEKSRYSELCSIVEKFRTAIKQPDQNTVHTSAGFAIRGYAGLGADISSDDDVSLQTPFDRRFSPERFGAFHTAYQRMAAELNRRLGHHAIQVFRSDLYQLLEHQNGQINTADLHRLIRSRVSGAGEKKAMEDTLPDLSELLKACSIDLSLHPDAEDAHAFRYPEWDDTLGDYLADRTRLLEREVRGSDTGFYEKTLSTFHGFVRRIRHAFDLLKPEEITILRPWQEGDAFDYRALLDYAIDKKAGQMPSDRLYIKRIKQIRDVATLLLVDLSKSTANIVDGSEVRVIDVEKQAIVLLCEALTVVGDRFAIAGFSGNGPLGVDYYRIKDMDTPFDGQVKRRINAMAPQRNTRMGAAIRHATACFRSIEARVRLLMILGDGFPNDLEYKGAHAVEDTRRAVMEARTARIHVKAITVNVSDNGQLDRLYGRSHHTLIGDIRDLPNQLVRVYSALTRH